MVCVSQTNPDAPHKPANRSDAQMRHPSQPVTYFRQVTMMSHRARAPIHVQLGSDTRPKSYGGQNPSPWASTPGSTYAAAPRHRDTKTPRHENTKAPSKYQYAYNLAAAPGPTARLHCVLPCDTLGPQCLVATEFDKARVELHLAICHAPRSCKPPTRYVPRESRARWRRHYMVRGRLPRSPEACHLV